MRGGPMKTSVSPLEIIALGLLLSVVPVNVARAQTQAPENPSVAEELTPNLELGPRLLSDISEEAQKIRRKQLLETTRPVMPPVPQAVKKSTYDAMLSVSGMSMRDLFNFMTAKKKVAEGVSFDDVIEAMDLKANEVNFKKVGHSMFWKDVGANSGLPTLRVEILHYCDALIGRKMLDYSPEFSIFIPCRITVMEDANGDIWLMTLDWDVSWLSMAWHPDSKLEEELKKDAIRIRDAMDEIMEAGATGEW